MLAITNAILVLKDHLMPEAVLFVEDGKIAGFGEMWNTPIPEGCEILDAEGQYLAPGMIDIHTHAGDGVYFTDDPFRAAKHYLKHGTTTVTPALYGNMNKQQLLAGIETVRNAMKERDGANIGGIYMEGPYLNPGFGCERENNPWAGDIRTEDYTELVDAGIDLVRAWCVAPEREGILDYVKYIKARNPEAVFTVAHSEATPEQVEALMPYGLRIGTHHTNATGTIIKYPECRGCCVDETVNYNHDIYAELIVDRRGIHVAPYMQRLVRKIKGDDRIILISDAFVADGTVPTTGGYEGVTDINFDWAGEIAGTKLTLDQCAHNFMIHTGASIVNVFNMASTNPARALGFTDRGEIAVGKRADLVITDHNICVKKVILQGEVR